MFLGSVQVSGLEAVHGCHLEASVLVDGEGLVACGNNPEGGFVEAVKRAASGASPQRFDSLVVSKEVSGAEELQSDSQARLNDPCPTSTDPNTRGTCLASSECASQGGSAEGNCAAGLCQIRLDFNTLQLPLDSEDAVYFETGSTGAAGTLDIVAGSGPGNRRYDIKVTYIECFNPNRPAFGCTQYFTGPTGTISSYNHAGGQMLQAQLYTNCIRQEL
eukprot:maker-scaffold1284_size50758-snap-gene-0.9 protein:Tk03442 transcript:maker-scaffold1284_size50758-snap-gene-0.9-mRNA-1 annotation:"hypothetical protein KGM_18655"